MTTEIEAKFLDIDHDSIRVRLQKLGATLEQPMTNMKRILFDSHNGSLDSNRAFIRLRDEGSKTTLTYKQFDELSVTGAKEIEIVVSNFDDAARILDIGGLVRGSYQESRREKWYVNNTEVVLDEWPWIPTFIEIEGASEAALKETASKLGLNWESAVFGDATVAYTHHYPNMHPSLKNDIGVLGNIRFGDDTPRLLNIKTGQ